MHLLQTADTFLSTLKAFPVPTNGPYFGFSTPGPPTYSYTGQQVNQVCDYITSPVAMFVSPPPNTPLGVRLAEAGELRLLPRVANLAIGIIIAYHSKTWYIRTVVERANANININDARIFVFFPGK